MAKECCGDSGGESGDGGESVVVVRVMVPVVMVLLVGRHRSALHRSVPCMEGRGEGVRGVSRGPTHLLYPLLTLLPPSCSHKGRRQIGHISPVFEACLTSSS